MLARLHGVPVVSVVAARATRRRRAPARLRRVRRAGGRLAPGGARHAPRPAAAVADRVHPVGALSRFAGRRADGARRAGDRRVTVLAGSRRRRPQPPTTSTRPGGRPRAGSGRSSAARWDAGSADPSPALLRRRRGGHARRARTPWPRSPPPGAPPSSSPHDRPHDEQRVTAAALAAAAGRSSSCDAWPATGWAARLRPGRAASTATAGAAGATAGRAERARVDVVHARRRPASAHDASRGRHPRPRPARAPAPRSASPGARRRVPDHYVVVAMDDPGSTLATAGTAPSRRGRASPATRGGCRWPRRATRASARALALGADVLVCLDVDCLAGRDLRRGLRRRRPRRARRTVWSGPVTYLPPPGAAGYALDGLDDARRPAPGAAGAGAPGAAARRATPTCSGRCRSRSTATPGDRVGGFCEEYVGYGGEDTDFGHAVAAAGAGAGLAGRRRAYHQHHPTCSPPVQHLDDILRNGRALPAPLGPVAHGGLARGLRGPRPRRARGRRVCRNAASAWNRAHADLGLTGQSSRSVRGSSPRGDAGHGADTWIARRRGDTLCVRVLTSR